MGTSKASAAVRREYGFGAGFQEEVAFEPALMDWVRQSCGQGQPGQREALEQRSGGQNICHEHQRSTVVSSLDPSWIPHAPSPLPLPFQTSF